ncbi:MAG TPA: glycosyltransferase, partial [Terriglobales bacterium]|nr:glycosyltransferase [Terriglobales bacterium]
MSAEVSVVVPIYNEAGNLDALHEELRAALDPLGLRFEIVYVDDGSSDESGAILDRIGAADPHVTVVRLARNYGQTAALACGFDHSTGATVVTLDGDR